MLSLSLWEILVVVLVAIVVVKPTDWPALINTIARWYREFRQFITGLQQTWQQTLNTDESNNTQKPKKTTNSMDDKPRSSS